MQKQNINFTSTPINPVYLKKIHDEKVTGKLRVTLSKLNSRDKEDKVAITKITSYWQLEENEKQLLKDFFKDFKSPKTDEHFLCLEVKNEDSLDKRIIGLMKYEKEKYPTFQNIHLSYLITKPEFSKANTERTLKGIGEILLGKMFYLANKINASNINFRSSDNKFYITSFEKAGIESGFLGNTLSFGNFSLKNSSFEKYFRYIEKKYKTTFSKTI